MSDDEEVGLPRAALNKMIKETLPNVRVANETRDLIYNCCLEFIRVVTSSANKLCVNELKKTISPEHVLRALEEVGFGPEYAAAANSVMDDCRQQAAKRLKRQNSRLDKLGIPEDELLRQQQELFDKARIEQAEAEQAQFIQFQQMMAAAAASSVPAETSLPSTSFAVPPAPGSVPTELIQAAALSNYATLNGNTSSSSRTTVTDQSNNLTANTSHGDDQTVIEGAFVEAGAAECSTLPSVPSKLTDEIKIGRSEPEKPSDSGETVNAHQIAIAQIQPAVSTTDKPPAVTSFDINDIDEDYDAD